MSRSNTNRETKSSTKVARQAARKLKCESLEKRELMAGITFSNNMVTIEGSNSRDIGVVSYNGTKIVVSIAGGASQTRTFNKTEVSRINFIGNGGNDEFHNNTDHQSHAWGGLGDDILFGGGAGDFLNGNEGNDRLVGRSGPDQMNGGTGHDLLEGGSGNDYLRGESGDDSIWGHDGNDQMIGDDGIDSLMGGLGNDALTGGNGADRLIGDDGNDTMNGNAGNDTLYGGNGSDALYGEAGNDNMYGGAGNDSLYGMNGADWLYGEDGNDYLSGGVDGSVDQMEGGRGADLFWIENYYSGGVRKRRDIVRDFSSSAGDKFSDRV